MHVGIEEPCDGLDAVFAVRKACFAVNGGCQSIFFCKQIFGVRVDERVVDVLDRKSTRLNSSH